VKRSLRPNHNLLCNGVISSARKDQAEAISFKSVQNSLRNLEDLGAIRKAGDTTRDGTLYFVALPEEIPWCAEAMKTIALAETKPKAIDEKKDVDYYNIAENRLKIFERDGYKCYKCGKQLTRFSATLDHIQPVSKEGDNSYDNLVTCCLHDNSCRRNIPIMDALLDEV
jgi:HNH endonuclease